MPMKTNTVSAPAGFLSDGKVLLRGMRRDDLEVYRRWLDNPEVTRFMEMGWKPTSEAALEATYREATEAFDAVVFVIEDRAGARPVGTTGLYLINWPGRRAQFRILIGEPDAFDKGYGTAATRLVVSYAFERLNMETVYLGVNEENVRAVKAYEKAGFVREGVQRHFIYNNGRYYNAVMMSVIRGDYFQGDTRS